jgi:hypothetical protein
MTDVLAEGFHFIFGNSLKVCVTEHGGGVVKIPPRILEVHNSNPGTH